MKISNPTTNIIAVLLFFVGSLTAQVNINIPSYTVDPDENIFVDVTVDDFTNIAACQFSIHWDPEVIEFFNLTDLDFEYLSSGNFNTQSASEGKISMVWTDASTTQNGVTVDDGTVFFRIIFKTIGAPGTQSGITFENDPTPIEIGDNTGAVLTPEFQTGLVTVEGTTAVGDIVNNVLLNKLDAYPNPFTNQTVLNIELSEASNNTLLSIYNMSGKLLSQQRRNFPAGKQQVTLPSDLFPAAGSYLIQLSTDTETIQEIVLKK